MRWWKSPEPTARSKNFSVGAGLGLAAGVCSLVLLLSCSGKRPSTDPKAKDAIFYTCSNATNGIPGEKLRQLSDDFFNDYVHDLEIRIDETMFRSFVLRGRRTYSRATLILDGETLQDVGFRLRGSGWARRLPKKQFKLHFGCKKMLVDGEGTTKTFPKLRKRRFHGLRKLNLRCNPDNDASLIVDKLTSEVFLAAGALYPRVGLAQVTINDRYQGMYLLTEHPEPTLLKIHLGNSKGNMFKTRYSGGKGATFMPESYSPSRYKTTRDLNDQAPEDLQRFIRQLDAVDSYATFARLFHVDRFINYWAAAVTAGHWDSIIGNYANDSIFHNAADGKWYLVGWDGDNSFGIGERFAWAPMCVSTTAPLSNAFGSAGKTAIFRKAHAIPELYTRYTNRVRQLLEKGFNQEHLIKRIDTLGKLVAPHLDKEPSHRRLTKFGFAAALDDLKEYVRARHRNLRPRFGMPVPKKSTARSTP